MPAGTFERWLEREARRERRRVTLEDAVVFGGFASYLGYRLGRFAATRCGQLLLHVAELGLLFFFSTRDVFIAAAAVSLAVQAASAAWWGGLESMRAGVRRRAGDGRFAAIAGWIERWLWLAGILASAIVFVTLAFALRAAVDGRFGIGSAYVTARLLGLGVEIVVRAFHNGVYALRRVYQPAWALLAPSLVRGALLLSLWPALGVWALPPASLGSTLAAAALTVRFSRRAYAELEIRWRPRRPRRRRRLRIARRAAGACAAAAAANLLAHSAHLLALAVLSLGTGDSTLWLDLFVYVLLAAPMLDAAAGWPRLFYPDLFTLEDRLVSAYRRRLEREMTRWAPVVGTVLWLPTALVLPLLPYGEDAPAAAFLTWLFFVARARIAAVQMVAFCARRYAGIIVLAVVLAAAAGVSMRNAGRHAGWVAVALASCSFGMPLGRRREQGPRSLMPLAALVAQGAGIPGRGRWVLAAFRPRRLLYGSQLLLLRFVRRAGAAGMASDRVVLWWEPEAPSAGRDARLLDSVLAARWRSPHDTAPGGLSTLRARCTAAEPLPVEQVVDEFGRRFPEGVAVRAGQVADPRMRRRLTWKERQAVLDEAVLHLYGRTPRRALPVDVSALIDDGHLAVIFLVPREVPAASRRAWRRRVRDVGIANAFATAAARGAGRDASAGRAPVAPSRRPAPPAPPPPRPPGSIAGESRATGSRASAPG